MNNPILLKTGGYKGGKIHDLIFCSGIVIFSFVFYSSSLIPTFYADDPIWLYLGKRFLTQGTFCSYPYYYRPLVTLFFAAQYFFFKMHYLYYHIFNVVLFTFGAVLFFILAKIIFKNRLIVYTITVFSVLNPLNFDKINWIGMQSYLWESIFYLTTFIGFVLYFEKNKTRYFLIYHLAFAGALWTNETGIILIPLLWVLYFSLLKEKKAVLKRKDLQRYFLGIFILFLFYAYLYAFKAYPRYSYFNQLGLDISWAKLEDFFNFLAIKLSYIILFFPGGNHFFDVRIFTQAFVVFVLFFLIIASWISKWFILWCVLPLLFSYFSPNQHHWMTSLISISSLGVWMLLGYGMQRFLFYVNHFSSKALKRLLYGSSILFFICTAFYLVGLAKPIGLKHLRQSDKYNYYADIVKKRCPQINGNLEVYFVDGSSFVYFNKEGDFYSFKKCKGSNLDFDYLSFLYHLKLLYNNENIKGFAISTKDVSALAGRENAVILSFIEGESAL